MVISHHIASELAAERQRDLRSSFARGWRFSLPFGRRKAEPEPVPPVVVASATGGDAPGRAGSPTCPTDAPPLRARRLRSRGVDVSVASQARAPRHERTGV